MAIEGHDAASRYTRQVVQAWPASVCPMARYCVHSTACTPHQVPLVKRLRHGYSLDSWWKSACRGHLKPGGAGEAAATVELLVWLWRHVSRVPLAGVSDLRQGSVSNSTACGALEVGRPRGEQSAVSGSLARWGRCWGRDIGGGCRDGGRREGGRRHCWPACSSWPPVHVAQYSPAPRPPSPFSARRVHS